jgi:hypothetical protein
MRQVTNSEIQTFKQCRRSWYLGYVRRLRKRSADGQEQAARTGTLVHDALEAYYKGQSPDSVLFDLAKRRNNDPDAEQYAKTYDLAHSMVEGYFDWLETTGADIGLEIHAVEEHLTCPAPKPYEDTVELLGKMDFQARRGDELLLVDHKTVLSFDQTISELPMNEQSRYYAVLQRRNHPEQALQGAIWNMLRKVRRGPRSKPPYFARYEMSWNDDQLRVFWRRIGGEIGEMMRAEERLLSGEDHHVVAYPTPSKDCSWRCPFVTVCAHMDDPRTDAESLLEHLYVESDPLERYHTGEADDSDL